MWAHIHSLIDNIKSYFGGLSLSLLSMKISQQYSISHLFNFFRILLQQFLLNIRLTTNYFFFYFTYCFSISFSQLYYSCCFLFALTFCTYTFVLKKTNSAVAVVIIILKLSVLNFLLISLSEKKIRSEKKEVGIRTKTHLLWLNLIHNFF